MTSLDAHQVALEKTAVATATATQPDNQTCEMGLPDQFSDIGERVVIMLRAAEESAQAILATVQSDALGIKEVADAMLRQVEEETTARSEEAARVLSEAREEAEAVIAQARREADQVRKDSLTEASRLHDAARRIHAQLNAANNSVIKSLEILPALIGEIDAAHDDTEQQSADPGPPSASDTSVSLHRPQADSSPSEPS